MSDQRSRVTSQHHVTHTVVHGARGKGRRGYRRRVCHPALDLHTRGIVPNGGHAHGTAREHGALFACVRPQPHDHRRDRRLDVLQGSCGQAAGTIQLCHFRHLLQRRDSGGAQWCQVRNEVSQQHDALAIVVQLLEGMNTHAAHRQRSNGIAITTYICQSRAHHAKPAPASADVCVCVRVSVCVP